MDNEFEKIAKQYEPMIQSMFRKYQIYRNHELLRQSALIYLWKAWMRYDGSRGSFAPYAFVAIRGGILDELKILQRYEDKYAPMEDDWLMQIAETTDHFSILDDPFHSLNPHINEEEKLILSAYYLENYQTKEIAQMIGKTVAATDKQRLRLLKRLSTISLEEQST